MAMAKRSTTQRIVPESTALSESTINRSKNGKHRFLFTTSALAQTQLEPALELGHWGGKALEAQPAVEQHPPYQTHLEQHAHRRTKNIRGQSAQDKHHESYGYGQKVYNAAHFPREHRPTSI